MGTTYAVHERDALDVLRALPDNSVDLVLTDPPFYRVKGEAWDRQWDRPEAFVAWIGQLCEQWQRVLRPNGSLYVFAGSGATGEAALTLGRSVILSELDPKWAAASRERCARSAAVAPVVELAQRRPEPLATTRPPIPT